MAVPHFAANLSMLYPEHAFLDRFAAAARPVCLGGRMSFDAVSIRPWPMPKHSIARVFT
jgi:hydroxypyruvate isomerase